jgi:hypothetical protein
MSMANSFSEPSITGKVYDLLSIIISTVLDMLLMLVFGCLNIGGYPFTTKPSAYF